MPPKIGSGASQVTRRSRSPGTGPDATHQPEAQPLRIRPMDNAVRGPGQPARVAAGDAPMAPRAGALRDPSPERPAPPRRSLCTRITRCLAVVAGLGAIALQAHRHQAAPDTASPTSPEPAPSPAPETRSPSAPPAWADPPLALQQDLFEQFRASPDARDPHKLAAFMTLMARAIARQPDTVDANLPVLLGVWRWNYGETLRMDNGREVSVGALLASSIVPAIAVELGGPHMPESQLRQLVLAVCREPENIPPTPQATGLLRTHARAVADALTQVVRLTTPGSSGESFAKRRQAEEAQLRRCLTMALDGPAADARWIPELVQVLQARGPQPVFGLAITPVHWARTVRQTFLAHTLAHHPASAIPPDRQRALNAMMRTLHALETAAQDAVLASSGKPLPEHRRVAGAPATEQAQATPRGDGGHRPSK